MKKIYSILLLLSFVSLANAQIEKSSVWLGDDVSASSNSYTSTGTNGNTSSQSSNFNIGISLGEAIKQNLILGFGLDWAGNRSKADTISSINLNTYSVEIFARKYINITKRFYFFQGVSADVGYTNGTSSGNVRGYDWRLNFYAGISYAINNKLYLEALIPNLLYYTYTHQKITEPGNTQTNNLFTEGSSISAITPLADITIGLQLIIGK